MFTSRATLLNLKNFLVIKMTLARLFNPNSMLIASLQSSNLTSEGETSIKVFLELVSCIRFQVVYIEKVTKYIVMNLVTLQFELSSCLEGREAMQKARNFLGLYADVIYCTVAIRMARHKRCLPFNHTRLGKTDIWRDFVKFPATCDSSLEQRLV